MTDLVRRRAIALALLASTACGARSPSPATPAATGTFIATLQVEALPPSEIDGTARLRARVGVTDPRGVERAATDLGEIGVDASSCGATDAPSLVDIGEDPADTEAPSAAFACSGVHTSWTVVLVGRANEIDVATQLSDEDEGQWDFQTLSLPAGAHVRLAPTLHEAPGIGEDASSAPQSPASSCAAIAEHNAGIVADARHEIEAGIDGGLPISTDAVLPTGGCFPYEHGAWAVRLETFSITGVSQVDERVLHVGLDGSEVALVDANVGANEQGILQDYCCSPSRQYTGFHVFDFDGDGVPELLFDVSSEGAEGGEDHRSWAVRFRAGQVEPYPMPEGFGDLRDVDGDGRPDAVATHALDDRMDCDGYAYERVEAPAVLAHSLADGTFSTSDAVAVAHARASCPRAPAVLVATRRERGAIVVDDAATATNVVCSRLWGVPVADVTRALMRDCTEFAHRADCSTLGHRRRRECRHRATLLEWAASTPAVLAAEPARRAAP